LHQSFWEKYGIFNEGIPPKRLRIGKEIEEDEVVALFGLCNCNGYRYYHNEDEALIAKVETLWMVMHQKKQVPNTQMINRAEAHEIAYEIKIKKKVNLCILVEWTIHNQLCILQTLEVTLCDNIKHVVDIINFVNSSREEEEEGSMPTNSMPKALNKQ